MLLSLFSMGMILCLFKLHIESLALGEVTVRANSSNPVFQLDKRTIYVENQISGAGGSASDILHKLPSVTQSPEGKIAIHGNSNLLIFINGKPSSLKGDELLQSTPAEEVKKIELITSPSAKYDAAGSGGIINLITKKRTMDGFNGNLFASDQLGGYSGDFLLNYKYKQFSFFAGIDQNRRRNQGEIDYVTDYLSYQSTQPQFAKSGTQKAQRTNTGFRSGFDYTPNERNQLSFTGNGGNFETANNGDWKIAIIPFGNISSKWNNASDVNYRNGRYGGADFTYEHKFHKPNKILSLSVL